MRYSVLLADCPWRYGNKRTGGSMRSLNDVYSPDSSGESTMSTDELCALPVASVVRGDGVGFLWATLPLLKDALRVLDAWGFEYKTMAVWDKARYGMGFWFRGQTEVLLVGAQPGARPIRSSMRNVQTEPEPDTFHDRYSALATLMASEMLIQEKRGAHSAKPAFQYDLAAEARKYPRDWGLELFARPHAHITVPAWVDQTGLELDGRDVRSAIPLIAASPGREWRERPTAGDHEETA